MFKRNQFVLSFLTLVLLGTMLSSSAQKPGPSITPAPLTNTSSFLVVSDTHFDPFTDEPSTIGRDTRTDLWDAAIQEITKILNGNSSQTKPSFVLMLGDLPLHHGNNEQRAQSIKTVLSYFRNAAVGNEVPLFYVPGNNDPVDGDYAPYTTATTDLDVDAKLSKYRWPVIEGDPNRQCFDAASYTGKGWYAAYPLGVGSKLKLVMMNTIPFSKHQTDAATLDEEMKWLSIELSKDVIEGDSVIIAMHIPPSEWSANIPYAGSTALNVFLGLMKKYSKNILAVIGAHTHYDGISKLYYGTKEEVDSTRSPYTLYISAPSVSPDHANNPSVKLIDYNAASFTIKDFYTLYYSGLTTANKTWDSVYSFKSSFHCPEATSIHNGTDRIDAVSDDTVREYLNSIQRVQAGPVIPKFPPKLNIYMEK